MSSNVESTPTPQESNTGCWLVVIIISLILALSYCGKTGESPEAVADFADSTAPSLPAAPVIDELSPSDVRMGVSHFGVVAQASVTGGAQIYSTNCYAALAKTFAWPMLDRCGGFDQAAVMMAERDGSYFDEGELSYFESETSAGRYLSAAINGGIDSDAADLRLAELQSISKKMSLPKKAVTIPAPSQVEEPAIDETVPEEGVADETVIAD
jgi:hypothetical protein